MSEVKKVVTKVDQSTKAMAKAASDLEKVVNGLVALSSVTETLASNAQVKEGELAAIDTDIKERERAAKAELNVRITENADGVLTRLMSERKLATITQADLDAVNAALFDANEDNAEAVDTAVRKAEQAAAIKYSAEKSKLESTQAVDSAEMKAANTALSTEVTFLKSTIADLKGMIEADRNAQIQMSENKSQPTINVNGK